MRSNQISQGRPVPMNALTGRFRRMKGILSRKGWAQHDADDLIQEAFLRMQLYSDGGGTVLEAEGFLLTTAIRLGLNARRDGHRELYLQQDVADLPYLVDSGPMPEDVVAAEQALIRMQEALNAVNHRTCEIFFMHRLEGFSHAQIAAQIGISVSAIEKHIASAVTILSRAFSSDDPADQAVDESPMCIRCHRQGAFK